MNPMLREPVEWSRTRWIFTIGVVFLAHLGFLFAFAAPPVKPPLAQKDGLQITLLIDAKSNERWLDSTRYDDPTILALGHRGGFSGSAWFGAEEVSVEALRWSGEPSFMRPAIETLGGSFLATAGAPSKSDALSSERRMPAFVTRSASTNPISSVSRVKYSPELDRLGIVQAPPAPRIESNESLRDSLVEIDVDRAGRVYSCRMSNERRTPPRATSERQLKADRMALDYARKVRFQPQPRKSGSLHSQSLDLTWGRLRFQWGYEPVVPEKEPDKQ
ncbi:MAG: hypothetical protein ACI8QF_004535 [Limisphaerales bacterium]|jgi:hypothetical protein